MRIIYLAIGLFLVCAPVTFGLDVTADHFDKTYEVGSKSRIIVRNSDGVTRIHAQTGSQVHVDVTKMVLHAKDEAQAKKKAESVSVVVSQSGNIIEARVIWPNIHFGIHIHEPEVQVQIVITAPPDADLEAHSADGILETLGFSGGEYQLSASDGDVTVTDMNGTTRLKMSDGKARLDRVEGTVEARLSDGTLDAQKVSGDVRLALGDGTMRVTGGSGTLDLSVRDGNLEATDCSGQARLSASDGKVFLRRFQGTVEASASDGRLELDGVFQSVVAKTSDGNIKISAADGSEMKQNWSLESRDGDISLNLPQSFEGDVDFSTRDGHINTDVPVTIIGSLSTSHLTGSIRENGRLLRIHTSDGDISVAGR